MLTRFLNKVDDSNFDLEGFFNVESGRFGVATDYFGACRASHLGDLSRVSEPCGDGCGRKPNTFLPGIAGDGDGLYVAWRIAFRPDALAGVIAVFDTASAISQSAWASIESDSKPTLKQHLVEFSGSMPVRLGRLTDASWLLLGDASANSENDLPLIDFQNTDGSDFDVFAFYDAANPELGLNPEEDAVPRVLLILDATVAGELVDEWPDAAAIDWQAEETMALSRPAMSHLEPITDEIAYMNLVAKVKAIQRGVGEAEEVYTFQAWSWIAWEVSQGFRNPDSGAATLRQLNFDFTGAIAEANLNILLAIRGQGKAANPAISRLRELLVS